MNSLSDFDPDKFYLGGLCKRGHDWNGTGKTLRAKNRRACLECEKLRYINGREGFIEAAKARRQKNPDYNKQSCKANYHRNKERRLQQRKEYYQQHKEYILAYRKEYVRQGRNIMIGRACNERRRAQMRGSIVQKIGSREMLSIKDLFNQECGYCGSTNDLTLDHFIPLSKGGTHTISNLVCACRSCNNRKHTSDPYTWYSQQEFFSKRKWNRLLKLLGKTQENYNQIPFL